MRNEPDKYDVLMPRVRKFAQVRWDVPVEVVDFKQRQIGIHIEACY